MATKISLIRILRTSIVCLQVLFNVAAAKELLPDEGFVHYRTEPTFRVNRINVIDIAEDRSQIQPGYIFVAPFSLPDDTWIGPEIFDQEGELVWQGKDTTNGRRVQDFTVCDYQGETCKHLCYSDADFRVLQGVRGTNRIFNDRYESVSRPYGSAYPLRFPNPHEFNMLEGGRTFLRSVYQLREVDLRLYAGEEMGYIEDGCFQEIDVETGSALFSWCSSITIPLWHGYVFLDIPENVANHTGEPYGEGTYHKPWDNQHLNSIDKTHEGDYIVSLRHLNQIAKIAGPNNPHGVNPGSILWTVGGKYSTFADANLTDLSRQHHVRVISMTATETVLSVFNNQWEANEAGRRISNAQLITLNNATAEIVSVRKFYNPEGEVSFAQGSAQLQPNGNMLVGWGTVPQATEFSPDGKVLWHARMAVHKGVYREDLQNYRTFKFDWVGRPVTAPRLLAYMANCSSAAGKKPLVAYVSWNGATEVKSYRFHTSSFGRRGPWMAAETFERSGFETRAVVQDAFGGNAGFRRYVSVEALDAHGNVLGHQMAKTFVPNEELKGKCDEDGCFDPVTFDYDPAMSCSEICATRARGVSVGVPLGCVILLGVVGYYTARRRKRPWLKSDVKSEKGHSNGSIA